jgi:hypothetical protein
MIKRPEDLPQKALTRLIENKNMRVDFTRMRVESTRTAAHSVWA